MNINSTYIADENHTYMIKSNILWLKVFYHNTTNGEYFKTLNETLDSHTKQKFSILGSTKTGFLVREKYEFLLEVPGRYGYNRWRQSVHPIDTTIHSNASTNGYEPIRLKWKSFFFGGLSRSSNNRRTIFDCSAGNGTDWWYPIGAKTYHSVNNTIPLFPGYEGTEILLWIRMPATGVDGFRIFTFIYKKNNRIMNYTFLIFLLSYS
jgi:hypothetical protein